MNRKIIYLLLPLIIVLGAGYFIDQKYYSITPPVISSPTATPSIILTLPTSTPTPEESSSPVSEEVPSSYLIKNFPFQSQAPLGNWDTLHEESCEEASLILVKYWQDGKSLSAQGMEDEIQKLVSWENSHGYKQDVTVAELSRISQDYYSMEKPEVKNNITIADIKKAVSEDHPVIVPAAGRLLGNPYFTSPGPVYHMVVVIGYNGNNIIVQDVGTKRGEEYKYNQNIFYNAIHDWAGTPENIESGKKSILILSTS